MSTGSCTVAMVRLSATTMLLLFTAPLMLLHLTSISVVHGFPEKITVPPEKWDPAPAGKEGWWRRCQEGLNPEAIQKGHPRPIDCDVDGEQVSQFFLLGGHRPRGIIVWWGHDAAHFLGHNVGGW
jgi:hypothetical protein